MVTKFAVKDTLSHNGIWKGERQIYRIHGWVELAKPANRRHIDVYYASLSKLHAVTLVPHRTCCVYIDGHLAIRLSLNHILEYHGREVSRRCLGVGGLLVSQSNGHR